MQWKTAAELNLKRAWACLVPLPAVFAGTKHVWGLNDFTGIPKGSEKEMERPESANVWDTSVWWVHIVKNKGKGIQRDANSVFARSMF